jgi:hypothetical protein
MWWLVWTCLSGVLALVAEGRHRVALLYIFAGLLFVQVWKFLPVGDLIWLCFAASWVAISAAISRHHVTSATLTLSSAMCYPIGRFGGFDFAPGDPMWTSALFWADIALLSAILVAGGRGVTMVGKRIGNWAVDRLADRRGAVANYLVRAKAPKD